MTTSTQNGQGKMQMDPPNGDNAGKSIGEVGMASLVKWSGKVDSQLNTLWGWRERQDIVQAEKAVALDELSRALQSAIARIDELESAMRKAGTETAAKVVVDPGLGDAVFELPPGVVDKRRTISGQLVYSQLCRVEHLLREAKAPLAYAAIGKEIGEQGMTVGRIVASDIANGGTRFSRTARGSVALREFGYVDDVNGDGAKKSVGPS